MHLTEEQIEDVRAAALLHDIGKLEISREILYKAAHLDEGETEEMRTHVERGVKILSSVGGSLRRILPIILAHHDRFDGSGYHPSKGEEIPIETRVITVADAYDAMISDRPTVGTHTPECCRRRFGQQAGPHGLGGLVQERTLSRSRFCSDNLKSLFREKSSCQVGWRKIEMATGLSHGFETRYR